MRPLSWEISALPKGNPLSSRLLSTRSLLNKSAPQMLAIGL